MNEEYFMSTLPVIGKAVLLIMPNTCNGRISVGVWVQQTDVGITHPL